MKPIGLVMIMVLALAGGLCLLVATTDDRELASLDLHHPTTILPVVASRLHAVPSSMSDLVDGATAGFRATVRKHEGPTQALER